MIDAPYDFTLVQWSVIAWMLGCTVMFGYLATSRIGRIIRAPSGDPFGADTLERGVLQMLLVFLWPVTLLALLALPFIAAMFAEDPNE